MNKRAFLLVLALGVVALIPPVVQQTLTVADDDIGYTAPGLALASARHEGQYTRLFLS